MLSDGVSSAIDLASGTGIASRVLLDRFPNARVWAFDASAAMLEVARSSDPPAVQHGVLRAEDLASTGLRNVDCVVCCSAIWQMDIARTLKQVSACLRPGGEMAFNLGESFFPHDRDANEANIRFQYALAQSAKQLGASRARARNNTPPTPSRPVALERLHVYLEQSGLELIRSEEFTQFATVEELVDWLSIPEYVPQIEGLSPESALIAVKQAAGSLPGHVTTTLWKNFLVRRHQSAR